MHETLIWATAVLCGLALMVGRYAYRDVFHPLVLIVPMFVFMYVYMPLRLIEEGQLYSYVSEEQCEFVQGIILLALAAFIVGCMQGSSQSSQPTWRLPVFYDRETIQKGAYVLGALGFLAWMSMMQNVGGLANAFSRPKGMGWSEYGYVREAAYLLIVGLLLLISPEGYDPKNKQWRIAVALFSAPYLIQGLLGAQRGPTFLVSVTLLMSWYLARRRRPSILLVLGGGGLLGFGMLFLVANRGEIYLGSDFEIGTDVSAFFEANEANEYVFGAGCIIASNQNDAFFWGRRYLAQVVARPIPKQIWATKYEDFGVVEITQNAGVSKTGLESVMGWREVPGASAGMVADVWVEFSWLSIAFLGMVGWMYGYTWRRAQWQTGPWTTLFTISILLSVYFVSQSGEAVIFRMLILSIPSYYVWRKAKRWGRGSPLAART